MQDPNLTDNEAGDLPSRPSASDLRSRLTVIRHRMPSRLAGRVRHVAVGAAALAVAGLATLGVSTASNDDPKVATTAAPMLGGALRSNDERADRSGREPAEPTAPPVSRAPVKDMPKPSIPASPPAEQATPAAAATVQAAAPPPAWVSPMPGAAITSCYGTRWGTHHAGVDLATPPGTPVLAVGAGTIEAAGWVFSGYGISVVVNHGNGYLTHYAHLSSAAVSPGQRVSPGQVIGYEGSTGDSTGPHLHFEVHNGMWNQVDPARWMRARGVDFAGC